MGNKENRDARLMFGITILTVLLMLAYKLIKLFREGLEFDF